jgi:hypothetical protein
MFAGGHERIASPAAAVGVHQIYASVPAGTRPPTGLSAADAISDAQKTTAKITRYLEEVGVDPAVWLNALETPPDKLYYLSPDELTKYKLATTVTP